MKWNNIMHSLGTLSSIGGIYVLYGYGWHVWQWPVVALFWILSSYFNAWSAYNSNKETERLHKELLSTIEELSKQELKTWEAELKLAKANDKINLAK